jgi:hypothetical protein
MDKKESKLRVLLIPRLHFLLQAHFTGDALNPGQSTDREFEMRSDAHLLSSWKRRTNGQ